MSRHRFVIEVDVDDEALAKHDGDKAAPPGDVDEWIASDLLAADALGIIELRHAQFVGDRLAADALGITRDEEIPEGGDDDDE